MTATISSLTASDPLRIAARRDGDRMMIRMAQWDSLSYSEKLAQSDLGRISWFRDVPGFELAWCGACVSEVLLDYTEYPEGACMVCDAVADSLSDRAAA